MAPVEQGVVVVVAEEEAGTGLELPGVDVNWEAVRRRSLCLEVVVVVVAAAVELH